MTTQQESYGQIANYNISPGTRADGQSSALEVDNQGNLKVNIVAGGTSTDYALQFATDSGVTTSYYLGQAAIGSATSAGVWQIMKIFTASGVQIKWANSNNAFNNIWDNRESLTYG